MKKISMFGRRVLVSVGAAGSAVAAASPCWADVLTDTKTAIEAAAGKAESVGGYVIAGIAILIVVPLIIGMIHKLGK